MDNKTERRFVPIDIIELRADNNGDEKPVISGYAAVFEKWGSEAYGFKEKIARGAFKQTIKTNDVRSTYNHDPNQLLGRTGNGTLRLKEDKRGLFMETDINTKDPIAMSTFAKVERGDVPGQSFSFEVVKEDWQYPEEGLPERTLIEVNLFDVGPVTFPFYEKTDVSVALRSLENWKKEHGIDDNESKSEPMPEEEQIIEEKAEPMPAEVEKNKEKAKQLKMRESLRRRKIKI